MGTINVAKVQEVVNHLEVSSQTLHRVRAGMESTWPPLPVDEYYQILFALARVDEARERLGKIVDQRREG
jgi:hypothetical protein